MGARRARPAEMVAAAYDLSTSLSDWFARAVALCRPHLDDGFGAFGVVFTKTPESFVHVHLDGAHPINHTLITVAASLGVFRSSPDGFAAQSCSDVIGVAKTRRLVAPVRGLIQALDCSGAWGIDGAGLTMVITAPRRAIGPAGAAEQRLARQVVPHLGAALRLRRGLTGLSLEAESAEAIFEPGGRCLHAQGMGESSSARELLRAAVVDQETNRARPADDENPRDALLGGRWSLVDRFDRQGRRHIVAYRNPPGVLDPRRLSPRERDVAERLARGMSQIDVASELGVRPSTVASVAASVIAKLGLGSTRELPLFWRDTAGHALALGRSDVVALYCAEPAAPAPCLTAAERAVLEGVVRGRSNRQIALYRETSTRTVANQVASLLRKLGVKSRSQLSAQSLAPALDVMDEMTKRE